jgi:hypothetical protein
MPKSAASKVSWLKKKRLLAPQKITKKGWTLPRLQRELSNIEYKDWYAIVGTMGDGYYFQVAFQDTCRDTGEMMEQHGRKWYVSKHMAKNELIQTALAAVLMAEEHEAREQFMYRGKRLYGPHIDLDALGEACNKLETRS